MSNIRAVRRALSEKSLGKSDALDALNREIVPLLRDVRERVNAAVETSTETLTSSGDISDGVQLVLADASLGPITLTPPPASLHHTRLAVVKVDATLNAVGLVGVSGVSVLNVQHDIIELFTDGLEWFGK